MLLHCVAQLTPLGSSCSQNRIMANLRPASRSSEAAARAQAEAIKGLIQKSISTINSSNSVAREERGNYEIQYKVCRYDYACGRNSYHFRLCAESGR